MIQSRAQSNIRQLVKNSLSEFWIGFTELAPLSLKVASLVFLLSVLFWLWLFSPTTMITEQGDFIPRSGKDAAAYATIEAMRIGEESPKKPLILILGSSTLGQAFASAAEIEKLVQQDTDLPWQVKMLTMPMQSHIGQLALLETALGSQQEKDPPIIVVIGAGMVQVTWDSERLSQYVSQPRLGLVSDWADREVERLGLSTPFRTGIYAIDNREFLLRNGRKAMYQWLRQKKMTRKIDSFNNNKFGGPNGIKTTQRILHAKDNLSFYLDHRQQLARQLGSFANVHLVLLDEPINPLWNDDLRNFSDEFTSQISETAKNLGIPYWQLFSSAGITPENYYDSLHLLAGVSQQRCREALAKRLVDYTQSLQVKQ